MKVIIEIGHNFPHFHENIYNFFTSHHENKNDLNRDIIIFLRITISQEYFSKLIKYMGILHSEVYIYEKKLLISKTNIL